MFVVFLGAPGAGKGTQAAVIAKKLDVPHIATGDLFRQAVQKGTKLGLLAKSYMEKGALVPDEVTIQMLSERLSQPDCKEGCVFDGFPRTLDQAKALDGVMATLKSKIDKAIDIEVPDAELLKRLGGRWICRKCQTPYHQVFSPPKVKGVCDKCGGELYQRADDNEETIKNRLKVYHSQTTPILNFYKDKLVTIDGAVEIAKVTEQIVKAMRVK
ncbi:MAG TPA: adenylate kinase [Dehalococcoidia bacterium]|nr:adenylate kinase [Dehalococcoidia bacterium]